AYSSSCVAFMVCSSSSFHATRGAYYSTIRIFFSPALSHDDEERARNATMDEESARRVECHDDEEHTRNATKDEESARQVKNRATCAASCNKFSKFTDNTHTPPQRLPG
ncbi:MAG: hypothetical protein AAGF86_19350, partial [Pseudomonadota bacterium]